MQATLREYIDTKCVTGPTQRIPVVEFVRHYRTFAAEAGVKHLKRGFIVTELCCAGFRVVIDDYDHRAHIIGLCIRGHWAEVGGRIVLEAATNDRT
jgi:hypothetical protein